MPVFLLLLMLKQRNKNKLVLDNYYNIKPKNKHMVRFRIVTLFCVLMGMFGVGAFAQDQSESTSEDDAMAADLYNMSLEDLLNIELETGSFLSLDLQNSSVSMTIISAEQIEASGARHLTEALEIYVPGFQYLINKWNGLIWGMRGVVGDRNTKFIYLVNGHKMNTESRDGAITELDLGLLDDVERIEVLRGPAGLVYGSGAIAGVINVVTKEHDKTTASASAKMSILGEGQIGKELQASGAVKINEDVSVKIDLGYRDSDGIGVDRSLLWGAPNWPYHMIYNKEDSATIANGIPTYASAYSTTGNYKVAGDIKYKNLRVYTRYTDQTSAYGGMFYKRLGAELFNRNYNYKNISNQATYSLPVGENEILFRAGADFNTNSIAVDFLDSLNNVDSVFTLETFGESRYNVGATYIFTSKERFQFAAGYEFRYYDIGKGMDGKNEVNENPLHLVVSEVDYTYSSLFTEGIFDISDKFSAHFGLRYDSHTRTALHGGVFSPKAGLVYKPAEKHSIKLVYQQSANNGTADSYEHNRNSIRPDGTVMYDHHYLNPTSHNEWDIVIGATTEDLHDLKPEKTRSLELMSYHQIGENLIILPSFSYNSITDLFVWQEKLSRMVNAGDYNSSNIDIDVQYSDKNYTIGVNHTIQRLEDMDVKEHEYSQAVPRFAGYKSEEGADGVTYYYPKATKFVDTMRFNSIRDAITVDGVNFKNLHTHTSKVFADIKPVKWLTLHSSARIFWGMKGRIPMHEFDPEAHDEDMKSENPSDIATVLDPYENDLADAGNYQYFDIQNKAQVKMNLGLTFKKDDFPLTASFHVYDVLAGTAENTNRNNLRAGTSFVPFSLNIYGVDYRSYALKVKYTF